MQKYTGYILGGILLFSLSIRLISFFQPHIENDEVIYQTLAQKVLKSPFDYTLQGTEILKQLPKSQYDYPVFRHPPLFIALLALTYKILGIQFGIFIPILSGVLTILAAFLIAKHIFSLKEAIATALILAFCPILLFTSTKIWIDATYMFLMCLSFYVFMLGFEKGGYLRVWLAGIIFGLAIITKYTSLGLAPALLIYALFKKSGFKRTLLCLVIFFAAAFLVTLPWLWFYRKAMGGLMYATHFKITQEYAEMFPFCKMTLERPDYFYFKELALVTPVYIFSTFALFKEPKNRENIVLLIWAATFLTAFIILFKLKTLGYAFRYLLPITVPLAMLSARAIVNQGRVILAVGIVFTCYQLAAGILNSFVFYAADIFPVFYYLKK